MNRIAVAKELLKLAKEVTGAAGKDALDFVREMYEVELKPEHAVPLSHEIQNARQKANRNRQWFTEYDMMAVVERFLDDKGYKFHRQVTKKACLVHELVKLAKLLVAGKIELEPVIKHPPFITYMVKEDGVVLGFLRKGKDTNTDTFPWQAFRPRFVPGSHPALGDMVGSFFDEDGGKNAAIKALKKG